MKHKYFAFVLSLFLTVNVLIITSVYDVVLYLSFLIVLVPTCILMLLVKKHNYLYFDVSLIIFYLFFFIVAPVCQLKSGSLPNTLPIKEDLIVATNINLCLFMFAYLFFRFILFPIKQKDCVQREFKLNNDKLVIFILLVLFLLAVTPDLPSIINNIINGENIGISERSTKLIREKYFYSIPIFLVAYWWYKNSGTFKLSNTVIFLFFITLLLLVKNPFLEKRNGLGPIYLSVLFFMYYKRITPERYMKWLIIALFIFFPLFSIVTHNDFGLIKVISGDVSLIGFLMNLSFIETFNTLHYDAWSNFMATIDYVQHYGVTYGAQLAGALLFFVPRSIWPSKPVSTGEMIGEYLSNHYAMWFTNLSNPFPSEGYVNFGILGVILFAFLLALISRGVKLLFIKGSFYVFIAWYITIHTIFLLRGDLMNGFAFLVGVLLAIWATPVLLNKVFKLVTKPVSLKIPNT